VPAFEVFRAHVACTLVVTQPDRPAGRGKRLVATPVKRAAEAAGVATIEPERLRDALPRLREEAPDLYAVASYGRIVPQAVLDVPRLVALNVHPSLLPLYRGATPLQSQLRDGVIESGVSVIAMDAGMDTGDVVMVERSAIGSVETYGELHDRFADLGAALLGRACDAAARGSLVRLGQRELGDEAEAARTATRPLRKEDLIIDPSTASETPARGLVDLVRSLSPAPGARVPLDLRGGPVKILAARILAEGPPVDVAPGTTLIANGTIVVRAVDGWVGAERVVLAGSKPMDAGELRNGYPVSRPERYARELDAWGMERRLVTR